MRETSGRTVHEVTKGSNLDLLIRGFHGIANRFVDAVGGGLQAIALALSTPNDNSAEVQKVIDQLTADLNTSTAGLKGAIDQQTKGDK